MRLSADRWRELRPRMDEALDLPPEERAAWLETLRQTDAAMATELADLLAEHDNARDESFLEGSPESHLRDLLNTDLSGTRLGNYVLDSRIGQGGMGTVWRAHRADGRFEGHAAIKLLNAGLLSEVAAQRFMREGTMLARLSHPCVARLLDSGVSAGGLPYLVLEYVEGDRIDRYCDEHKLDARERIELFLDVLAAVTHAHTHLIVHRDIKPSNVLVSAQGHVKLLDFGIAKLLDEDGPQDLNHASTSVAGTRAMTPQFAAPEQLLGQSVTTVTDVYSLGVLLYLLLTNQHPSGMHGAASPGSYIQAVVEGRSVRASTAASTTTTTSPTVLEENAQNRATTPAKLRKLLTGDLDNILAKALKVDPRERYASASAFADDLRRYLNHEPVSARADSLAYRTARFVRRHRAASAAAALAAVALVVGTAGTAWQAREAHQQAQRTAAVHAFMLDLFGASGRQRPTAVKADETRARELLDVGAQRVDDSLTTSAQAKSDILETLATMYAGLGLNGQALAMHEKRLLLARQTAQESWFGGETLVADALLKIASSAHLSGMAVRRNEALDEAQSILLAQRRQDTALHGQLWVAMAQRHITGDAKQALAAADKALAVFERVNDPRQLAQAQRWRAMALRWQGDYAGADKVSLQALELVRLHDAGNDELQFALLGIRSDALLNLQQIPAARDILEQAVAAAVRARGEGHPNTAMMRVRWAHTLELTGRVAECIEQTREAARLLERAVGPQDARLLPAALDLLGICQTQHGAFEEGIRNQERALALHTAADPSAVSVAILSRSLALSLVDSGQYQRAMDLIERAQSIVDTAGQAHMRGDMVYARALAALAQGEAARAGSVIAELEQRPAGGLLMAEGVALLRSEIALAGREPDAGARVEKARAVLQAGGVLQGELPLLEAELLVLEGRWHLAQGRADAALAPLQRAVELRERSLAPHSLRLAQARVWLGRAQAAGGDVAAARGLLEEARRSHEAHPLIAPHYQSELAALQDDLARLPVRPAASSAVQPAGTTR